MEITGMIEWGNGEPCPICGKEFDKPDMKHLLSHPETMKKLFPTDDKKEYEPLEDKMDSWIPDGRRHTIDKIIVDVQSASKGLYQEFTNSILETSDLDPINIVRHFGDLQMKWFKDILDPNIKSSRRN